jgi:hypothetical protein
VRLRTIAVLALCAACGVDPLSVARQSAPVFKTVVVSANSNNVLSAIVSVHVSDADSAAVRFRAFGESAANESLTPPVSVAGDTAVLAVLGLRASSRYEFSVVAYGAGGVTNSAQRELTTAALPSDLPTYTASGTDPSPGYVVFAAGPYGLVIDNTGRVVWYHRFENGAGLNFITQRTGRYYARPPTPAANDVEPWVEIDVLGNVRRTLGCARGLAARLHDLIVQADNSYWLLCDEMRTLDLSAIGGVVGARVTGTAVQHVGADGSLLFQWSPFDHFAISDGDPAEITRPSVNWTHGNALDFDTDSNVIVSFRNLGEITKINRSTGAVMWRMGGRRNEFEFSGTSMPAFVGQHSARVVTRGEMLLLDNLGDPIQSRAERYMIDESRKSATLVRSHASAPAVVTQIGGSVQALPRSRVLVTFGTAGRVEEYDDAGSVVWRIVGDAGYVFRAQRIRSLYSLAP